MTYEPKTGMITKFEAGVIYRAMKEKTIKVRAATTSWLYDNAKYIDYAYVMRNYNQNPQVYDRIQQATRAILEENFEEAQRLLILWEEDMIRRAGKKSTFYRYQKELA